MQNTDKLHCLSGSSFVIMLKLIAPMTSQCNKYKIIQNRIQFIKNYKDTS